MQHSRLFLQHGGYKLQTVTPFYNTTVTVMSLNSDRSKV